MLDADENDLISRVGPGTPMGNLMRQYWLPAMLSTELPETDCRPVRVLLLGEKLIAFRDTKGRAALIGNHCPHRGASLFFGRNEKGGLRCVYHGWKFDLDGRCLETPNEPPESNFKEMLRAAAYPCQERGGIVWAYMGPRQTPPPLPLLEANLLPEQGREMAAFSRECNWLQGLEGDIDTSHVGLLHFGGLTPEDAPQGSFMRVSVRDRAPRLEVVDTEGGAMYAAFRPAAAGWVDCRIVQFLFPFYALLEPGVLGLEVGLRAWVPMDDEHLMFFGINKLRRQPERTPETEGRSGFEMLPNSTDWLGRFRLAANGTNDFMLDREMQRTGDYTGIPGIFTQDAAVTESMGAIVDRTAEHLGTSDAMIIRVRQRLAAAARALETAGVTPPGVDQARAYAVRSGGVWLPSDTDWLQATSELRTVPVEILQYQGDGTNDA